MRRALWLVPLGGLAALAGLLLLWRPSSAGTEKSAQGPQP